MKKSWVIIAVVVVVVLGIYGWWKGTYNTFIQLDQNVKAQLGQLNNVYQNRSDLIPNLQNTVKGASDAERQTLEAVVQARSRASSIQLTPEALNDPQAMQNFQQAQSQLSGSLSRLLVVAEQYPDLKSQQAFIDFMARLTEVENRIRTERTRYNSAVNEYNRKVLSFPSSILAGMSGFREYPYFQAGEGAQNAPKVDFGSGQSSSGTSNATGQSNQAPTTAPKVEEQPHGAVRPAPAR